MRMVYYIVPLMLSMDALAQEAEQAPRQEYGWKHGLVAGFTLTQVSYTDWAQGGENSLSYTGSADGKSVNDQPSTSWTNEYRFAFGQSRLGQQGLRKTDDKIDLSTVLTYKFGGYIDPYAAATLKTQFAGGFSYDAAGNATQISAFFDPAFLTQSVGASYQVSKEIKTRLGPALREIITRNFNQYADDPSTAGVEKTKVDAGLESVTNVDWQIEENLQFSSQLELFAPFKKLNEVVVRNNNTLAAKVGKYITVIFNVQLINEKQISPRTQVKEALALGLSYTLF